MALRSGEGAPTKCFYESLDIEDRRCTQDDIKKAYKKAALKWHPGFPLVPPALDSVTSGCHLD